MKKIGALLIFISSMLLSTEAQARDLMLAVTTLSDASSRPAVEKVLRALDVELGRHTDLELTVRAPDSPLARALQACPEETRLHCWSLAALDPALGDPAAKYLLMITVRPVDASHEEYATLLIDLEAARGADEDAIFASSGYGASERILTESPETTAKKVLFGAPRTIFERGGRWYANAKPDPQPETAVITATASPAVVDHTRPLRDVVAWSGVGLAAIGTVIIASALAAGGDAVVRPCHVSDCDDVDRRSFTAFGASDRAERPARSLGGLPIAPLGYSLAITGVVWSLGVWLFDRDDRPLWIDLGAGLLLGATAFTASVLVD